jgi:cation diffusion facilitator CzcD-associated flavoprotein CzcO
MRLYRFKHYFDMERDYAGFNIETGRPIRQALAKENEAYVKKMAPQKYWDALIPKSEIGCKRKVLDTEYLKSLWRENVELISNDPVERITEEGVVTRSGREVKADAIVLAIGFATQQMLCPMEIVGRNGLSLNSYVSLHVWIIEDFKMDISDLAMQWDTTTKGVAQAYFGTVIPHFPNCKFTCVLQR